MGSEMVLSYENIEITEKDIDCLKSCQFLNDKIINFYLKYMYRTLLNHEQQRKVHIFDSFFSEALDQMDESRVIRWLRRIDVFEKEYILVPALIDQHWFLIVICNASSLLPADNIENGYIRRKRPRIVIMDSMRSHAEQKKPQLMEYLYEFFRIACVTQKHMSTAQIGDLSSRMPYFEKYVTEQRNNFDCGICMLTNAEQFFIDTFDIRNDFNIDPEIEFRLSGARQKRAALRKLIRKLVELTDMERAVMNSTKHTK